MPVFQPPVVQREIAAGGGPAVIDFASRNGRIVEGAGFFQKVCSVEQLDNPVPVFCAKRQAINLRFGQFETFECGAAGAAAAAVEARAELVYRLLRSQYMGNPGFRHADIIHGRLLMCFGVRE